MLKLKQSIWFGFLPLSQPPNVEQIVFATGRNIVLKIWILYIAIISCSQLKIIKGKRNGIIIASSWQVERETLFILWLLE